MHYVSGFKAWSFCQQQTTILLTLHVLPILSMVPNTTAVQQAIICTLKCHGSSNDDVQEALVDCHNISDHQIKHIFTRYREKENYDKVGHLSGCPHMLSSHDVCVTLWHLPNKDSANASDLQHKYFPQVNVITVKQALWEQGLHPYYKVSVPFISNKNLHMWKLWAKGHLDWTIPNWMAVTFSDESIFHLFGSDGIEWCWRKPEQRLDPRLPRKNWSMEVGRSLCGGWSQHLGLATLYTLREIWTRSYIQEY